MKNYQLDLAAAKEVNQLLLNLPTLDDFTLDYQSLIIEIDQRYLKLTPSQKQLVNGEILLLPYYQDKIAMLLYLHQEAS